MLKPTIDAVIWPSIQPIRAEAGAVIRDLLIVDWGATTVNTATLTFATAPTSAQYRATVIA